MNRMLTVLGILLLFSVFLVGCETTGKVVYNETKETKINGRCATSLNGCVNGTFLDVADANTAYLWKCLGIKGGTNASCSLAKTTGNLYVSSNPTAANIYVDSVLKGTTPKVVEGKVGSHIIKVTKSGYKDYITTKYIYAGRTATLSVTLTRAT